MPAYYNEIDPFAADWLRELIKAGHIAPGEVDTRSIEDVVPTDLAGFIQCHFFAGIAVWSYALRLAGWPDDRPVWTGSCPCQPFSTAGKSKGFADERHLWPAFFHLISQRRPLTIFGEQVASKDGLVWLDLVHADLEGTGYSCGAVDTCSAGFGAPHIRQRLYWVADASMQQPQQLAGEGARPGEKENGRSFREFARCSYPVRLADAEMHGRRFGIVGNEIDSECPTSGGGQDQGRWGNDPAYGQPDVRVADAMPTGRPAWWTGTGYRPATGGGESCRMENSLGLRPGGRDDGLPQSDSGKTVSKNQTPGSLPAGGLADAASQQEHKEQQRPSCAERGRGANEPRGCGLADAIPTTGPINGYWRNADWLFCRDGKWRPVESGTFPLAHGAPARVGRLRGYGNAINAIQAKEFIRCFMNAGRWPDVSSLPLLTPEAGQ